MTYFKDKLFEIAYFLTRQLRGPTSPPLHRMSGLPMSEISGSTIVHTYTHMHTYTFLLRKDFNFVAKLKKACQEAVGKKKQLLSYNCFWTVSKIHLHCLLLLTRFPYGVEYFFYYYFLNNWQILGCAPPSLI